MRSFIAVVLLPNWDFFHSEIFDFVFKVKTIKLEQTEKE